MGRKRNRVVIIERAQIVAKTSGNGVDESKGGSPEAS